MSTFEPKPFGKYFLTDRIAIGGMAEIYKAKTFGVDGFEKILAIKKILSHYSSDKEFITMLTDEAKLVVNLSHANIVQVYDLGRVGDDYFISMEFIDGINLRDLVERGKELGEMIPVPVAIFIITEVCRGLDYAHNKKGPDGSPLNIVHRDISPQNILVSYEGGVKLVDFGIAKAAMNLSQTHDGILKGKVNYMAPEQAFGKPIDQRTDLFSLGIVMYELLTQKRLFAGESQMEILKRIRNTKITADFFGSEIPAVLKPILVKTLAYSVKQRYASAADLQIELTRILYSHFAAFNPRDLMSLLYSWFPKKKEHQQEPDDDNERETILVSARTQRPEQVNLVHRPENDDAVEPGGRGPELKNVDVEAPTIKPADGISAGMFKPVREDDDFVAVERTEKSEITQPKETLDQMLARKKRLHLPHVPLFVLLLVAVALVLLMGYFVAVKYGAVWFDRNTPKPWRVVSDRDIVSPSIITETDLQVVSEPGGAIVFLDGVKQAGMTPLVLKGLLLNQEYKIKVSNAGYESTERTLFLRDVQTAPLSVVLSKQVPATFTLQVLSEPAGARVFVDGTDSGFSTPTDLRGLFVEKNYLVNLRLDKHQVYEKSISSVSTDKQILQAKLVPVPLATLVIGSLPPGAAISLNGAQTGFVTPHTFSSLAFPATYVLSLSLQGYENFGQTIAVGEPKAYEVKSVLVKTAMLTVPVKISSNIVGATVLIDNKKMGQTPFDAVLKPGTYHVVVQKADYSAESKQMTLSANDFKSGELYFKLEKTAPVQPVKNNTTVPPDTNSTKKDPYAAFNTTNSNVSGVAKLRVDSQPRGAKVTIDGSPKGITPLVADGLKKNQTITVTVSKAGYQTWSRSLSLSKDRTEINANLVK